MRCSFESQFNIHIWWKILVSFGLYMYTGTPLLQAGAVLSCIMSTAMHCSYNLRCSCLPIECRRCEFVRSSRRLDCLLHKRFFPQSSGVYEMTQLQRWHKIYFLYWFSLQEVCTSRLITYHWCTEPWSSFLSDKGRNWGTTVNVDGNCNFCIKSAIPESTMLIVKLAVIHCKSAAFVYVHVHVIHGMYAYFGFNIIYKHETKASTKFIFPIPWQTNHTGRNI